MKANKSDSDKYSKAIDLTQEGSDMMVEFFNEMEDDKRVFDEETLELIDKEKIKYGTHSTSKRINSVRPFYF